MAGMEQLEIHSKSYLVRWIQVAGGNTISWSLQPHKRSINFGIFKHPGLANGATPNLSALTEHQATTPNLDNESESQRKVSVTSVTTPKGDGKTPLVIDKLEKLGIKSVAWTGRCESDQVSMGRYDVPFGESGFYGLVFDNTHSKQLSKTVTFVLMTYPSSSPPKSGHHLHFSQAMKSSSSLGGAGGGGSRGPSPSLLPLSDSNESLPHDVDPNHMVLADARPRSKQGVESKTGNGASFYTGVLSKKRRKRNQGYARRFFSLDFTSATLSYYKNRSSSALRGSIPLSLAVVAVDEKSRYISVDSGAEIWILKAHSQRDLYGWREALERAAQTASVPVSPLVANDHTKAAAQPGPVEDNDWEKIEALVGRVAGITDAVRRLTKDTEPSSLPEGHGLAIKDFSTLSSGTPSPTEMDSGDYFQQGKEKSPRPAFWRRKSSGTNQNPAGFFKRSDSEQKRYGSNSLAPPSSSSPIPIQIQKRNAPVGYRTAKDEHQIHNNCMALLGDLDKVVAQFSSLLAESRQKRPPQRPIPVSRASLDSTISQEFYDAEDGLQQSSSQVLTIQADSEEESTERDDMSVVDSASSSEVDQDDTYARISEHDQPSGFPPKPKSLTPLPKDAISRRTAIHPSSGPPPSLISFLRKNVGKDLSTIAMPVTANEPTSLLQRQAEQLEYSHLLGSAVVAPPETGEQLLHIAAFALSALACNRAKERAVRKPFNPMLGETYELVREDLGFRFLAEKVSHRPVRVACQAESRKWTFTHAPAPTQRFWGKSAELITDGRVRVALHPDGASSAPSYFSWTPASCFLRNILAGEKYVEPVGTLTVHDERSGAKAVASFKASGVFSGGRSEDVSVVAYSPDGAPLSLSLRGKWTSSLALVPYQKAGAAGAAEERTIWTATPMPATASKQYGMPPFALQLNELTPLESDALPPTDSRLRPDQRAYEDGNVENAETLKRQLEEGQRRRRREAENGGGVWEPRWFKNVGNAGEEGDEAWVLKGEGEDKDRGYWDVREAVVGFKGGKWDGVREVFELG